MVGITVFCRKHLETQESEAVSECHNLLNTNKS